MLLNYDTERNFSFNFLKNSFKSNIFLCFESVLKIFHLNKTFFLFQFDTVERNLKKYLIKQSYRYYKRCWYKNKTIEN